MPSNPITWPDVDSSWVCRTQLDAEVKPAQAILPGNNAKEPQEWHSKVPEWFEVAQHFHQTEGWAVWKWPDGYRIPSQEFWRVSGDLHLLTHQRYKNSIYNISLRQIKQELLIRYLQMQRTKELMHFRRSKKQEAGGVSWGKQSPIYRFIRHGWNPDGPCSLYRQIFLCIERPSEPTLVHASFQVKIFSISKLLKPQSGKNLICIHLRTATCTTRNYKQLNASSLSLIGTIKQHYTCRKGNLNYTIT